MVEIICVEKLNSFNMYLVVVRLAVSFKNDIKCLNANSSCFLQNVKHYN